MSIQKAILSVLAIVLCASIAFAQEEKKDDDSKVQEVYRAFGVAMNAGVAGVLEFHITRWTTPEERQALINAVVQNGEKNQDKTVDMLRKQPETGWTRTQSGAGMRGWPSVRLHYAYQFPQEDGSRVVVLITDRNIGMAEAMSASRSNDYQVSGLVMQLKKGEDGKEKGSGTLFAAAKIGYNKEKNQVEIESLGAQPVKLTDIRREK